MTGHWHGGKGSAPRKTSISQEEWDNRWDAIFGRDKEKKSEQEDKLTRYNDETIEMKEKLSD